MNKHEAIEEIKDLYSFVMEDGPFEVDLINKRQAIDIISQIDEPKKIAVPQVAVEFYEKYKDGMLALDEWFSDFYSKEAIEDFPRMEELTEWLYDNDNETNSRRELALATLVTIGIDAVEIEQEKLYTVEIPNPNIIGNEHTVLVKNGFKQIVMVRVYGDNWRTSKWHHLTESEIRKDFEWAWQWAKEVENDTEV